MRNTKTLTKFINANATDKFMCLGRREKERRRARPRLAVDEADRGQREAGRAAGGGRRHDGRGYID